MPVVFPTGTDPFTGTTPVIQGTAESELLNAQAGEYLVSGATWDATVTNVRVGDNYRVGLHFDLYDRDEAGNPRSPATFTNFQLRLTPVAGTRTSTLTIGIVPEEHPAAYSATLAPGTRSEVTCGTGALDDSAGVHTFQLTSSVLSTYVETVGWIGRIALTLTAAGTAPAGDISLVGLQVATAPRLVVDSFPFHTGDSSRWRKRTRAVHDYKMGYPYLSDEAVSDGYLEGVMVHKDSWDPVDPGPTYVPPPNEGVVSDEIVDQET